jgi:pyridoxamine 5'-phosphate oxidase family protein
MTCIMTNSILSEREAIYLRSQRIVRIATVAQSSIDSLQPDVVPVGYDFDGEYFYVSGMNLLKSKKA